MSNSFCAAFDQRWFVEMPNASTPSDGNDWTPTPLMSFEPRPWSRVSLMPHAYQSAVPLAGPRFLMLAAVRPSLLTSTWLISCGASEYGTRSVTPLLLPDVGVNCATPATCVNAVAEQETPAHGTTAPPA